MYVHSGRCKRARKGLGQTLNKDKKTGLETLGNYEPYLFSASRLLRRLDVCLHCVRLALSGIRAGRTWGWLPSSACFVGLGVNGLVAGLLLIVSFLALPY